MGYDMKRFNEWTELEKDISGVLIKAYDEAEMHSFKRGLKNYENLGWIFQDAFFDIVELYENARGWTLIDDE